MDSTKHAAFSNLHDIDTTRHQTSEEAEEDGAMGMEQLHLLDTLYVESYQYVDYISRGIELADSSLYVCLSQWEKKVGRPTNLKPPVAGDASSSRSRRWCSKRHTHLRPHIVLVTEKLQYFLS